MTQNKKVDFIQFDKRVMHRFVQTKKTTPKELELHFTKLPDMAENSEDISVRIFGEKKGHGAR